MVTFDNIMADEVIIGDKEINKVLEEDRIISISDLIRAMDKYPNIDWEQIKTKINRMQV